MLPSRRSTAIRRGETGAAGPEPPRARTANSARRESIQRSAERGTRAEREQRALQILGQRAAGADEAATGADLGEQLVVVAQHQLAFVDQHLHDLLMGRGQLAFARDRVAAQARRDRARARATASR